MKGFPGQFAVRAFWLSRWRFTGFSFRAAFTSQSSFQWAYKDLSLLASRKVNFNSCCHSATEDLFLPKDLWFGCLFISKCDTELLNKVCDSLHPA